MWMSEYFKQSNMSYSDSRMTLGKLSIKQFLQEYWQKKPLLIRQAFASFQTPISPDELAGLACEEQVNSRIIIEEGGEHPWQAINGPMDESIFESLPETHWTLVVNDLEKYVPELAWITDQFRFIPEWHLDDLMSSYAAPQGSVGPHVDLYDVFILQGSGQRRWQINTRPVTDDNVISGLDIRLQKEFTAEQEWVLNAGDMLYIPSGVSHHGVSIGESMSFSIGFKATTHEALVNDYIAHLTQDLSIHKTYVLPNEGEPAHANEISAAAIAEVQKIFRHYLDPENPTLTRWFGRFVSDTRMDYLNECEYPLDSSQSLLSFMTEQSLMLYRHPASRFAFTCSEDETLLFVDGEDYNVSEAFAVGLCQQRMLDLAELLKLSNDKEQALLLQLYNQGKLYLFEHDAD
jgi:50S ribosomal protein L16 3-hydroxylase